MLAQSQSPNAGPISPNSTPVFLSQLVDPTYDPTPIPIIQKSEIIITHRGFGCEILDLLPEIFGSGQFSDVEIRIGEHSFCGHRLVLSAISEHFRGRFRNGVMADSNISIIRYDDLDSNAFRQAMEFYYKGKVILATTEVSNLLVLADRLLLAELRSSCVRLLTTSMDLDTSLTILEVGETLNCMELIRAAEDFIRCHIHEVASSFHWINLTKAHVISVLSNDVLKIRSEAEVFQYICTWIDGVEDRRRDFYELCVSCVRLALIPAHILAKSVIPRIQACDDQRFQMLLLGVIQYQQLGVLPEWVPNQLAIPRASTTRLLIIGSIMEGNRRRSHHPFFCLTFGAQPSPLRPIPEIHESAVAVCGSSVYVASRNIENFAIVIHKYTPAQDRWESLPDLTVPRTLIGLCAIQKKLVAIGGATNDHQVVSTVEIFDETINRWMLSKSMHRSGVACGSVFVEELLYLALKTSIMTDEPQYMLVTYDPASDRWEDLAPIPIKTERCRLCAAYGDVFGEEPMMQIASRKLDLILVGYFRKKFSC